MSKLNNHTMVRILQEDIEWLEKQPHSLEKIHILVVLEAAIITEVKLRDAEAKLDKFADLRDRYRKTANKYPAATTSPLKVDSNIDRILNPQQTDK